MTFSKEDKAAWLNSEIMQELEKLAEDVLNGPPSEAFQPIENVAAAETWEDEDLEEKITEAVEEFEQPTVPIKEEFVIAYNQRLLTNIEKIAHRLSDQRNITAAYRVERSLRQLKALLREEN